MPKTLKSSTKVHIEGRGSVILRPSDHIATGGEGSIHRVGKDMAVKLYSDPKAMRQLDIQDKLKLLKAMIHPYVVAPREMVFSEAHELIGFSMVYETGHPLPRVFTNDFWKKEGFGISHAKTLVEEMRDVVSFAHSKGALLVDANELNWFVKFNGGNPEPRVVDVDSWSIGRFKSSVIMPSIRDWRASGFDENSDWFSWAVVTFQVFTGLHPYKGTHPSFKRGEFIERMKANESVFAKDVRLNQAVRDFSLIPPALLSWYEAVFQNGERSIPPSPLSTSGRVSSISRVSSFQTGPTGALIYEKLLEISGDQVVRVFPSGAALLASGRLVEVRTKREIARSVDPDAEVVRTADGWLILESHNDVARLWYSDDRELKAEMLSFSAEARQILEGGNRLFVLGERGLTEIKLHNFGKKMLASAGETWSAMPNSTICFDGLAIQDAMGAKFVLMPLEEGIVQIRVRELDGLRPLEGRFGNRFASIIAADKSGSYKRLDLVFEKDYSSYIAWVEEVDQPDLNLAALPKGVTACIEQDGEIIISVPQTQKVTKIKDKNLSTSMLLGNIGDQVVYIEKGAIWSVRMA